MKHGDGTESGGLVAYMPAVTNKERLMKGSIAVVAICISSKAFAGSACDKPTSDFDGLYCLNKIYQQADTELNSNYKTLAPLLDATGKAALRHGQLGWIQERNNTCSRRIDDGFFVDLKCATDSTIKRAEFLQSRIRECRSSGCLNSQL
jgi:uncharacterized protein YecT (DUF1311 family)